MPFQRRNETYIESRSEMSSCQYGISEREPVEAAKAWASRLVAGEAARSGTNTRDAAARVARRLRSSKSTVLALLYSPPKDVGARLYEALQNAVEAEVRREIEALQNELAALGGGRNSLDQSQIQEVEADLLALREKVERLRGRKA